MLAFTRRCFAQKPTGPRRGEIILLAQRKLNFADVLIVPQKSFVMSRSQVDISCAYEFKYSPHVWNGVPIFSSNMDTVTNIPTAELLAKQEWISIFPKHFNLEWQDGELPAILGSTNNYSLSCGTSEADMKLMLKVADRIKTTFGKPVKLITVDIANGYLDRLITVCASLRQAMPEAVLIAGNVVNPEGVYELVHNGSVDVVKVGIGSGAACTTRLKTGVGYPQFSAVSECAEAAASYGAHIISDGGAVYPGDLAKAFGANSSFVMLGSMLAGHNESPGLLIKDEKSGMMFKEYYGMSSKKANEKYAGGLKSYRAAEGKVVHIPLKGDLIETVLDIEGGIRSACTYVNARSLQELAQKCCFIEVQA